MRGTLAHEWLAGAIGGSAVAGGAVGGPLWATVLDVATATATAAIAVHAAERRALDLGQARADSTRRLRRAARDLASRDGAPLAADAVDLVCRVRTCDPRALRSAAILVGRATTAHARGLVLQLLGSWSAPLRDLAQLGAPFAAARATLDAAAFVQEMTRSVPTPLEASAPAEVERAQEEEAPPESGRFVRVDSYETADWEVAA